jgi:hypothetical protein
MGFFSITISRSYHHIKNTHILGLKHKFITSRVDSNRNKEMSHQVGMNNQATGEGVQWSTPVDASSHCQEQHVKISLKSDHKWPSNLWRKSLCENTIFSLLSLFARASLHKIDYFFSLSLAWKTASPSFLFLGRKTRESRTMRDFSLLQNGGLLWQPLF